MFYFILTVHLILCVMIVGLVLLQQGKGAQVGAILSGSSNTLFGAAGASTKTLAKLTTFLAIAFFVTSIILIRLYGSVSGSTSHVVAPGRANANHLQGTVLGEMVKSESDAAVSDVSGNAVPANPNVNTTTTEPKAQEAVK